MRRELIVDALILLLLALVGYGFLLTPGEAPYSPHSDFVAQGLATKTVLWNSLRAGQGIPFWRADELAGSVALTNPQSLYTYPLHFLFYLVEPVKAVGPTFWLHFLAAGFVGYIVAMSLGLGRGARLLMAAAMMFSFKLIMVTYSAWLPAIPNIVLFPLLFAAMFRALKRPGPSAAILLALAGGLILHAGHLQFTYYSLLFLLVLLVAHVVSRGRGRRWEFVRRSLPFLIGGGLLAAGLAAYLLIPLAADAPLLSRGEASVDFFMGGHPPGPRHLRTLLLPEALGTPLDGSYDPVELWEDVAYFGIVPLLLAVVGMVLGRKRRHAAYLSGCFIASLLLALSGPLARLMYAVVPGFKLFRLPGRFLFFAAFFGIALAGIGLDEIIVRLHAGRRRVRLAGVVVAVLIAIVAVEGSVYARRYLKMSPQERILPDEGSREFFAHDSRGDEVYRVAPIYRPTVSYGWAATHGIEMITGFDPYNYSHYQRYMDILCDGKCQPVGARVWTDVSRVARWDFVDVLNVKYLVFPKRVALPENRFSHHATLEDQRIFNFYQGFSRGNLHVYRNRRCLSRAFFVPKVQCAADRTEAVRLVRGANLRETAVVEGDVLLPASRMMAGEGDAVSIQPSGSGLRITVAGEDARFLVISEVWHPGWRATIDGEPLALFRTNLALLGAHIPRGSHEIRLRFRPPYWRLGLAIACLAALACALLMIIEVHRARRARLSHLREHPLIDTGQMEVG